MFLFSVVSRDEPTVIAYLLLRMTINSNYELIPKLNNRLEQATERVCVCKLHICNIMFVVVCAFIKTTVDMFDGATEHKACEARSKLTVPKINPTDSVMGEWVMVDMVREVSSLHIAIYTYFLLLYIILCFSGNLKTPWRQERC